MNKKELKQDVSSRYITNIVRVKGSFVFVEISCIVDDKEYRAFDFAKWSTEDMDTVHKATRQYQQMLDMDCGCKNCRQSMKELAHLIEKYNWSGDQGIKIVTGRAVADIVGQIMGDRVADKLIAEKSRSGFSAPELIEMNMGGK